MWSRRPQNEQRTTTSPGPLIKTKLSALSTSTSMNNKEVRQSGNSKMTRNSYQPYGPLQQRQTGGGGAARAQQQQRHAAYYPGGQLHARRTVSALTSATQLRQTRSIHGAGKFHPVRECVHPIALLRSCGELGAFPYEHIATSDWNTLDDRRRNGMIG